MHPTLEESRRHRTGGDSSWSRAQDRGAGFWRTFALVGPDHGRFFRPVITGGAAAGYSQIQRTPPNHD